MSASKKIDPEESHHLDSLFEAGDVEETRNPPTTSSEFDQLVMEQEAKDQRRKKKSKTRTVSASVFDRTTHETREMIHSQDWETVEPRHLVALFCLMHEKCYGVPCTELDSKERYKAVHVAKHFVNREFNGDIQAVVEYFRWLWTREISRHKRRTENGREPTRLNIYYLFGQRTLTDYRLVRTTNHRR